MNDAKRLGLVAVALLTALAASGCGRKTPPMTPVEGKVLYNGRPLTFGCVMFQPDEGWPAVGHLQSNGTFSLATYKPGDGAVIGRNRVRVTCFEGQSADAPGGSEGSLGKSLIPRRYNNLRESGIVVDVAANMEPVVIELTD